MSLKRLGCLITQVLRSFAHFGRIKIMRLTVCRSRKQILLVKKTKNKNSAICKSGNDMDSPHWKQCYYSEAEC
jgi:hypothetical protein